MGQKQEKINVEFLDGHIQDGVKTGNNAAWFCSCRELLIGRSGLSKGPTRGLVVECPNCQHTYFVKPDGGNYKALISVKEISRDSL